jgi:hypothetical protein
MNSNIDWTQFVQKVADTVVLVPCMSFVLYLDLTDDGGLIDFYERSREALGERFTHYQAEDMKGFRKIGAQLDTRVRGWFDSSKRGKPSYYLQMSDGDPNEAVSATNFQFNVFRRPWELWTQERQAKEFALRDQAISDGRFLYPRVASELRVTLPLDHPLGEPARFRDWVLSFKLIRESPTFSAYGGYAVNYYDQPVNASIHYPAHDLLASTCLRYPGFDWDGGGLLPRMLRYVPAVPGFRPLVKRASWLNLLCDNTLGALGGRDRVREALKSAAAISAVDLPHGLAISAGEVPGIGDAAEADTLPTYRELARILRPIRIPDIDGPNGPVLNAAFANQWLNVFDSAST